MPATAPTADAFSGLLDHVRDRAQDYFPDLGDDSRVRITCFVQRSYSSLYWVSVDSAVSSKKIIVKVSEQAEQQFAALRSLWPQFSAQKLWRIPRPLDYLAQDSALVMEEAQGVPLIKKMPRLLWFGRQLQVVVADCQRAGAWLRFYHDIGLADSPAPLNAEGRWPGLDGTLQDLDQAGFQATLSPLLKTELLPRVERVVTEPRPISHVHGDFSADNVMIDNDRVIVIDIAAELRNVIDLDVAAFLNSLAMLRLTRPVPAAALERMREAFLHGYFGADKRSPVVSCFLQAIGLADIALEIIQRRPGRATRFWVEQTVGRALGVVIGQLRRLS